ncbi:Tc5 transposase DNA-binding domain [Popillia japonica]|uniref:Tc5 transposase DNA-binding domain n=1 Tax=Popillia japonica TaxID=7064 RepID=A0AAW1L6I3_POPJA
MEKGKQFRDELGLSETEYVFSDGWLYRFKTRHGIRKLDVAGEIRSANRNASEEYKEDVENLVELHNLSASQIYNADETGLLWRCLPNSTLADRDEKCVKGFKMNKERLTVLLCANSSGDQMLTPYVIGKYKKLRAYKDKTFQLFIEFSPMRG